MGDYGACKETPPGGCSICGEGKCITNPDAIFEYPDQPRVSCGSLQEVGYNGVIEMQYCKHFWRLPQIEVCGCAAPTLVPSASPTESLAPSTSPTVSQVPTMSPTGTPQPSQVVTV